MIAEAATKKRGTPATVPSPPVTPEQLAVAAADGARLAVSVWGDGEVLLMIPGLGSTQEMYDPLIPHLAQRRRVAVYDPRGVGRSSGGPGPFTMAQLAADAAAVLEGVGAVGGAVWGASMGGMVAQHLALDHPHRVSALMLAATTCGGATAVRAAPEATAALLGRGATTPEEAYRRACSVMYTPDFLRSHRDVVEAEVRRRAENPVDPRVFRAQYEAVRRHDTAARLGEITAPTLVLHGTDDLVVPVGNAMILASRIPRAQLVLIEGGSHLFFHEEPERTARIVLRFLDELAVGRGAA